MMVMKIRIWFFRTWAAAQHGVYQEYPSDIDAFAAIPARLALEQQQWQQASAIKTQNPDYTRRCPSG
jgi:hypothetical protein